MPQKPQRASNSSKINPIRQRVEKTVGRIEAIPRRTRLFASSLLFVFSLGGLYWTDYLESKFPATEEQKMKMEELKRVRFPTRGDWEEAREQAARAKALQQGDPKRN